MIDLDQFERLIKSATDGPIIEIEDEEFHPDYELFSGTETMNAGNPKPMFAWEWDEDRDLLLFMWNNATDILEALRAADEMADYMIGEHPEAEIESEYCQIIRAYHKARRKQ